MSELREMLLNRKYNKNIVDAGLKKAKEMDRLEALKRVVKEGNDRVVLAVKYHPLYQVFQAVIYMTSCLNCGKQYVGQTKRKFADRIREHWLTIVNKKDTAVGMHFNSKGHSVDDIRAMVLEKVMPNSNRFLLEREDKWIKTLDTKEPFGLNINN